jgi:hypothetical protein
VGQHVVVLRKLGVGRVEVEAGADAKVPVGVLAFYAGAAGRGVWEKQRDALSGGWTKESTFLRSGQDQG